MKVKKPSMKGTKNCKYLGHFAKNKYIQQGHNDSGSISMMELTKRAMGMLPDPKSGVTESEESAIEVPDEYGMEPSDYRSDQRRQEREKRDQGSSSSGNYGWETAVKNGKRSHRLIRR